jgi:hypothetical protein
VNAVVAAENPDPIRGLREAMARIGPGEWIGSPDIKPPTPTLVAHRTINNVSAALQ